MAASLDFNRARSATVPATIACCVRLDEALTERSACGAAAISLGEVCCSPGSVVCSIAGGHDPASGGNPAASLPSARCPGRLHQLGALGLAVSRCAASNTRSNQRRRRDAGSYAGGQIWFDVNSLINETFGTSSGIQVGAAYLVVGTHEFVGATHLLTLTSQGYAAAAHGYCLPGSHRRQRCRGGVDVLHAFGQWRPDGSGRRRVLPEQRLRPSDSVVGGTRREHSPHHCFGPGTPGWLH